MTDTKTVETLADLSGTFVKFEEHPILGVSGQARLLTFGLHPESFERYRDDARALIRVIKNEGASLEEDRKRTLRLELNSMGVSNLLVALAYEISEKGYQNEIPHGASCQYCGEELRKNASREAIEGRDCGSCAEED